MCLGRISNQVSRNDATTATKVPNQPFRLRMTGAFIVSFAEFSSFPLHPLGQIELELHSVVGDVDADWQVALAIDVLFFVRLVRQESLPGFDRLRRLDGARHGQVGRGVRGRAGRR